MELTIKEYLTVGSPIPPMTDAMRRLGDVSFEMSEAFAKAQMLSALTDNPFIRGMIEEERIREQEAVAAMLLNDVKTTSASLNTFVAQHCMIEKGRIALSLEREVSKPDWRHNRMGFLDGLQRHGRRRR